MSDNLSTKNEITWCPGCFNIKILEAVKSVFEDLIKNGTKKEEIAIVSGIGCHAKIFDYLNVSGIYGLHGRVLPTSLGIKLGNPKLTVVGFAGDGDTYAEGIAHFVHMGRYNPDMTLIVHDNQIFALTTGQPTPTTQSKYVSKVTPQGETNPPLNPLKLALASNISFISRTMAADVEQTTEIIKKAIYHKGFSFVEVLQPCLQFNKEMNDIEKLIYKIDKIPTDKKSAETLAEEWDYSSHDIKIPTGIFFQESRPTLTDLWPQLSRHPEE